MRRTAFFLTPVALLAGCTAGPDYARPKVEASDGVWLAPVPSGTLDAEWWRLLEDPVLDGLVTDALAHNLDIAQAEARLREARATSEAARNRRLPQGNVTASATEQQTSANGQLPVDNIPGYDRRISLFDAGIDASWEVDLWGGVERSVQAADARAQAAALRVEDTQLRIIAEVVRTYVDLRGAQARKSVLDDEAQVRAQVQQLIELRYRAGEASLADAAAARQRTQAARALIPAPDAEATAAAYSLSLLTGRGPEALAFLARTTAPLPESPVIVPTGIRSELLQRRPDVRAAEADLMAATADIGIETANLYPRFSLIGNLGQQARSIGDFADSSSTRFSVGPSFSWPIFSLGRIRAQIRAADARADASAAAYEKTVLAALAESETAANRYANAVASRNYREQAVAEASKADALAELRFHKGEDDRIQRLDTRSALIQAHQSLAIAQAEATAAWIAFVKALGGGPHRNTSRVP